MAKLSRKQREKIEALRDRLWPDLMKEELWYRKDATGFTTIPRTLPIICSIIDDLTKGKPASSTYFELWCRAYDQMYISLSRQDEMAYHAGFRGQRAKRQWIDRLRSLSDLGFIKTASGTSGEMSHTVIINPHIALFRLWKAKTPGLTQDAYNAFVERANDVGATDLETDPQPPQLADYGDIGDDIPF